MHFVFVFAPVSVYAHVYVFVFVYVHVFVYACILASVFVHDMYMYTVRMRMCICMCACMCSCVCRCMDVVTRRPGLLRRLGPLRPLGRSHWLSRLFLHRRTSQHRMRPADTTTLRGLIECGSMVCFCFVFVLPGVSGFLLSCRQADPSAASVARATYTLLLDPCGVMDSYPFLKL